MAAHAAEVVAAAVTVVRAAPELEGKGKEVLQGGVDG